MQFLMYLPAIIAAVRAAEEALPGQTRGKDKLALVLAAVDPSDKHAESLMAALATFVSRVVVLLFPH